MENLIETISNSMGRSRFELLKNLMEGKSFDDILSTIDTPIKRGTIVELPTTGLLYPIHKLPPTEKTYVGELLYISDGKKPIVLESRNKLRTVILPKGVALVSSFVAFNQIDPLVKKYNNTPVVLEYITLLRRCTNHLRLKMYKSLKANYYGYNNR